MSVIPTPILTKVIAKDDTITWQLTCETCFRHFEMMDNFYQHVPICKPVEWKIPAESIHDLATTFLSERMKYLPIKESLGLTYTLERFIYFLKTKGYMMETV